MGTGAVPPAELVMVSTHSVREKIFLMVDLGRFLVVSCCRHDKEAVGKAGAAFEVFNDM